MFSSTTNEEAAAENALKKQHYPYWPIKSMDGKEQYSVLELYKAAKLYSQFFYDNKKTQLLDEACKLGLYTALFRRIKDNINNVDKLDVPLLLTDIERMANLYWSPACIDAVVSLTQLAKLVSSIPSQKDIIDRFKIANKAGTKGTQSHTDVIEPMLIPILRRAAKYHYLAADFNDAEASVKLKNLICPDEQYNGPVAEACLKITTEILEDLGISSNAFFEQVQKDVSEMKIEQSNKNDL
jgi:hypothetical protein